MVVKPENPFTLELPADKPERENGFFYFNKD